MCYHLRMIAHFLYFIIVEDLSQFKIGFSKHPKKRIKEIQTSIGKTVNLFIEHSINDKDCCMFVEKRLHFEYSKYKSREAKTEWFDFQFYLKDKNLTPVKAKELFILSIEKAIKLYYDQQQTNNE